jgi:hypothetical protein
MSGEVKIFNIQGQIDKVGTRKGDKSLVLTISTQEIKPHEAALIMMMQDSHIYFFMSEQQFKADDLLDLIPEPKDPGRKYSQSQILRFELQKLHMKLGGTKESFEQYYQTIMQQLIDGYRKKIEELEKGK